MLEQILDRDNLNRAYKQVKRNKGAGEIDGVQVDETFALPEGTQGGTCTIPPGRQIPFQSRTQVEIPKGNGKSRKLGIPTVVDRLIQQILSEAIKDGRAISLIHKFLRAGVMSEGMFEDSPEGVPQGGPLSPLLGNIMLNECDQELEERGHKFVRYADDLLIFC